LGRASMAAFIKGTIFMLFFTQVHSSSLAHN
jgi:hypothetical protein